MFDIIKIKLVIKIKERSMKKQLTYIATFMITIIILIGLTTIVNLIPKEAMKKNILESAKYLQKREEKRQKQQQLLAIRTDEYADAITLGIAYGIDKKHPLKSFLYAKYYRENVAQTQALMDSVENDIKPNQEYLRYFHGSILLIKPLLILFSVKQIYMILFIVFLILTIILLKELWKKAKSLAILTVISFIMTFMYFTPFTLEYIWNILTMLIVSIIALKIEQKNEQLLPYLFIISGIFTCYFDFLTTETLPCLFPLSLITIIRIKEKRLKTGKEAFKFVLKLGIIYFLSYAFSWFTKWLLASIVLKINAMNFVTNQALLRINGQIAEKWSIQALNAVKENLYMLVPVCFLKVGKLFILILTGIIIADIYIVADKKEKWIAGVLLFLAVIPIIRYIALSNHSYIHNFFTYRALTVTIMDLIGILIYGIDWKGRKNEKN